MKHKSIEGVKQYPYQSVSVALEVIPRTLLQNCGADVIRLITELRVFSFFIFYFFILKTTLNNISSTYHLRPSMLKTLLATAALVLMERRDASLTWRKSRFGNLLRVLFLFLLSFWIENVYFHSQGPNIEDCNRSSLLAFACWWYREWNIKQATTERTTAATALTGGDGTDATAVSMSRTNRKN